MLPQLQSEANFLRVILHAVIHSSCPITENTEKPIDVTGLRQQWTVSMFPWRTEMHWGRDQCNFRYEN